MSREQISKFNLYSYMYIRVLAKWRERIQVVGSTHTMVEILQQHLNVIYQIQQR